jgi:hypothetical protein
MDHGPRTAPMSHVALLLPDKPPILLPTNITPAKNINEVTTKEVRNIRGC